MTFNSAYKLRVLEQEHFCCHYCSEHAGTIDHKIPIADGGSNQRENLVASCFDCNQAKGAIISYKTFVRAVRRFGRLPPNFSTTTNLRKLRAISNICKHIDDPHRRWTIIEAKFGEDALRLVRRAKVEVEFEPIACFAP